MFLKNKQLYLKEDRWCLGRTIEGPESLIIPVFKMTYEGLSKPYFLSQGRIIFQGLLYVTERSYKWLGHEGVPFKEVVTCLPELKAYMNEEEPHEH